MLTGIIATPDTGLQNEIIHKKKNITKYGSVQLDAEIGDHEPQTSDSQIKRPPLRVIFVCAVLLFSFTDKNVRTKVSLVGQYLRKANDRLFTDTDLFLEDDSYSPLIGKRTLESALMHDNRVLPEPFSTLDPVKDLKMHSFSRDDSSSPQKRLLGRLSEGIDKTRYPLPTNKWYENLLLVSDQEEGPSDNHRAYTVPYVVDAAGPISGLRLFGTRVLGMQRIVQVSFVYTHGLTIGSAANIYVTGNISTEAIPKRYQLFSDLSGDGKEKASAYPLTPLGLTLKWVRGL